MKTRTEYNKKYYQEHKDKILKVSATRYAIYKNEINLRHKKYRKSEHGRIVLHSKKFNVSYAEAKYWLNIKQCQICGDNLAVATDHDHKTGKIRGRLCYRCNRAIGALGDTVELLEKAVNYLKGGLWESVAETKGECDCSYIGTVTIVPKIDTIFCDMDGVLTDFVGEVNKKLGIIDIPTNEGKWLWDWYEEHGFLEDDVNEICTEDFWANLEWTKEGQNIWYSVPDIDIYFLSVPMKDANATINGKKRWLARNLSYCNLHVRWNTPIISCLPKSLYAKPTTLLIDDKDENVDEFYKAGGNAILIARPWNSRWKDANRTLELFKEDLENLRKEGKL
jgi:hypothetical protein